VGVEQISLPFRIAVLVFLVVGALWFTVLRPKSGGEAPAATTAPGVTGLANDVAKAKGAVDASNAGAAGTEAAANAVGGSGSTTTPAATGSAKPAQAAKAPKAVKPAKPGLADDAAPGDPSRPLLAAVDRGKIAVVLFWNDKAADDRATRRALRSIDLHRGKVVATAVPVRDVGKYEAITRGAQVLESPTVLVIGAGGKARAITGYTESKEIDQAVSDIGGKGFAGRKAFQLTGFAKVADDTCKDFGYAVDQQADPPTTVSELSRVLGIADSERQRARDRLAKAKATTPAQRGLKSSLIAFAAHDSKWLGDARRKLKGGAEPANVFLALVQLENDAIKSYAPAARKLHARGCYASS
jgi:hypothetical protein